MSRPAGGAAVAPRTHRSVYVDHGSEYREATGYPPSGDPRSRCGQPGAVTVGRLRVVMPPKPGNPCTVGEAVMYALACLMVGQGNPDIIRRYGPEVGLTLA